MPARRLWEGFQCEEQYEATRAWLSHGQRRRHECCAHRLIDRLLGHDMESTHCFFLATLQLLQLGVTRRIYRVNTWVKRRGNFNRTLALPVWELDGSADLVRSRFWCGTAVWLGVDIGTDTKGWLSCGLNGAVIFCSQDMTFLKVKTAC